MGVTAHPVGFPRPHWAEPAEQHQIHLWPGVWLRGLIQPPPGYGIAYIDWAATGIRNRGGAVRRRPMMEAYRSGDPYLAFAKQAGAVPAGATKATHNAVRDQFSAVLAVQYGMGADALAQRLGHRQSAHASYCDCTGKPIGCSGLGPTGLWTTRC